uniref:isoleucine--tRNA ligase n=1 Tax=Sinocyclocheilus grahami TaxID=75366 RepID=A0A672SC19_SINGR
METVWWVFKQLYEKGLVYRGVKVMPFSTACNTPLSNFEAHQNYKDVQDPSVIVTFPLLEDETVSFLAWTTTPWTLPSNLALCVSPDFIYVKVKGALHLSLTIVLGMHRNESSFAKTDKLCFCLYRFPGKTLKGKKYKPLFEYFIKCKESGAFSVVVDNYVRDDDGTGVVHQAPYFGADDYRVCMDYKIIQRDSAPICPVDSSGVFTAEVTHFAGQYVKDADKNIIKWLKENGRLVSSSSFKHSYPFCWRSDTPLIYKAVPSWFVRVEHMVEKLLDNNSKCYWYSESGVSTPVCDLRVCDDLECWFFVGLEELTGAKVSDLHRESIDGLTIPSRCGKGQLKRVSEVFDCWFESGSMPYAQVHYPFENRREFEDAFPADFIAEGIDQTRGWFYTLLVLSTALFGKPPFKNVIVNGLVLASDGQKMSKRKKNYPDPSLIVQNYGADALRLYLINSPVVRAENLRFKEEGVRDVLKDVLLPWYNAYRFLVQNIQRLQKEEAIEFLYNESTASVSDNIMDKWIQSFTQSLIQFFRDEMGAYRLYTVVPKLVKFVDMLTNWYVRTNRRRLKGESGTEDCMRALETLFSVLFSMCRLMAPFTPFITELMYQNLCHLIDPASVEEKDTASIHYLMLPHVRESLIDKRIESAVSQMQSVIELGRVIRDRKTLPVKVREHLPAFTTTRSTHKYIHEGDSELNVRQLTLSTDKDKYGIRLRAEPDHMVLGKRLKGAFKSVTASIKELKSDELEIFQRTGSIVVDGHELHEDDLRLMYSFDQTSGTPSQYEAHSDAQVLVLLDVTPDQTMQDEGVAREVINRIQKLRKKGHLVPSDEITVYYSSQPAGEYLDKVIQAHTDFILATTKAPLKPYPVAQNASVIVQEKTQLKGSDLELTIVRGSSVSRALLTTAACAYVNLRVTLKDRQQGTGRTLTVTSGSSPADASSSDSLLCPYVNLQLMNASPAECKTGDVATLLLMNPAGKNALLFPDLLCEAAKVFGLRGRKLTLCLNEELTDELEASSLHTLNTKTLFVKVLPTTAEA